ncbi:MAG: hypothetical protein BWY09_02263 [Candidatus Hydrogenedentes bacterium ADurb.Bin179]|nr:MAG: hypothetical protein BWY09_02263 [Candidatus Hydrogenedentes bacterium ADurb.Bin179]
MGMMKMGIMELMIWMVFPVTTSRPMLMITMTSASIMGAMINIGLRKKKIINRKITSMARGAEMAI